MYSLEQKKVIDNLNSNILVTAPAGTGKTSTLGKRISAIIEKGLANPEEILCLTFTNKAAKEMEERFNQKEKSAIVRTIHSFCMDIIREQIKNLDALSDNFSIFDEEDMKEAIKDILFKNYNMSIEDSHANRIISFLELARKYDIFSDDFENINRNLFRDRAGYIKNEICITNSFEYYHAFFLFLESKGGEILKKYNEFKKKENALDFTDLLIKVYRLFKNEEIKDYYRKKFKYIHVDEMQDVSLFEYDLMEQIFEYSYIVMCGDLCQTIYEWRGSAPEVVISRFKGKYIPIEVEFKENYRCTKNILEAANGFIRNATKTFCKRDEIRDSFTEKEYGDKLVIRSFYDDFSEAKWILEEIDNLGEKAKGNVAILCRGNKQNSTLSSNIAKLMVADKYYGNKDMSFFLAEEFKLFRKKEIKLALSFFKVIINKNDDYSLRYILKSLNYGIGPKLRERFRDDDIRRLGVGLTDFLYDCTMEGDYYQPLYNSLSQGKLVVFDVESTGLDINNDEIIQIAGIKLDENGKVLDKFERFIKPQKSVGSSQEVHGFSDKFLQSKGENGKIVLSDFARFCKDCVLSGHNVKFDLSILDSNLKKYNLNPLNYKMYYDSLIMARRFLDEENYKLGYLSSKLNLFYVPDHNAMNDILATGELILYFYKNFIKPNEEKRRFIYSSSKEKFIHIYDAFKELSNFRENERPADLLKRVYEKGNFYNIYGKEENRKKSLDSFIKICTDIDNKNENTIQSLTKILDYSSLSNSQMDIVTGNENKIPIITVHQAKGLEYEYVFIASVNNNIFPSYRSVKNKNVSEEIKLFYVAMTRAKKKLFISSSTKPSAFIDMIPKNNILGSEYI